MIKSPLKNRPRRRSVIAALLALALLLPAWWWTGLWRQERLIAEKRFQVAEILAVQGRSLGTEINGRLAILKALKTFVDRRIRADQEIAPAEFAAFGAGLSSGASGVRSLSIAPGGITQFISPTGSNESLTGQDLLRDARPQVRADVQRAVRSHRIVISGPYALRPRGLGLVARQAVYAKENLWGLISLVLDLPPHPHRSGSGHPAAGSADRPAGSFRPSPVREENRLGGKPRFLSGRPPRRVLETGRPSRGGLDRGRGETPSSSSAG